MSASPVLADSSFYINQLRRGLDPLKTLALAAATRDLAVCGVIRCEVGRGLRNSRLRERLTAAWDVMLNVPTDNRLWAAAETLAWELDREGKVLPLTDILIACCAKRAGAVVLTDDQHFREIPGLRVTDHLEL
jgi:predicted nucleic acid-binding protein